MSKKFSAPIIISALFLLFISAVGFAQNKEPNPESETAGQCGSTWTNLWGAEIVVGEGRVAKTHVRYPVDMTTTGFDTLLGQAIQQGCDLKIVLRDNWTTHSFQCVGASAYTRNFWCRSAGFGASTNEEWSDVIDTSNSAKYSSSPTFGIFFDEDASSTDYLLTMFSITAQGKPMALTDILPLGGKPGFTAPNAFVDVFGKL